MKVKSLTRRSVVLTLVAAAGLAGCGKKGDLAPPEGEEDLYTYPGTYPKPSSQVPGVNKERTPQNTTPDNISIFPDSRTKTKTY
ncbi:lipoprotein [Pelagibius sp. Alg239-R121]|uniref:LPS translocon maturation chaperone LptM n=1 Tax=Pelagibius sp. Alg239-R121 TaxID=2993448 RepID=UPI0024A6C1BC|nr:lipoprotein [Pelagibius sp. Alg239-R121]